MTELLTPESSEAQIREYIARRIAEGISRMAAEDEAAFAVSGPDTLEGDLIEGE